MFVFNEKDNLEKDITNLLSEVYFNNYNKSKMNIRDPL